MTDVPTTTRTSGPTRRGRTAALWAAQVALGALFAGGGLAKLTGDAQMIDMFDEIGAGQGLRYVVGALEVAGAVGLLVPPLAAAAALGLAALMVGATITNVLILETGTVLSLVLLVVAAAIAWARLRRASTASSPPASGRATPAGGAAGSSTGGLMLTRSSARSSAGGRCG